MTPFKGEQTPAFAESDAESSDWRNIHGERIKPPVFNRLPSPLYPGTAKAMQAELDRMEADFKARGRKRPLKAHTSEGTAFQRGTEYAPDVQAALKAITARRNGISRALAGVKGEQL